MRESAPKHEDFCTLLRNGGDDADILTRKLFNVNMRLFQASKEYKEIIQHISSYLQWCATTEKVGYSKPRGYSGANAGIPFNIIVANGKLMINPVLTHQTGTRVVASNCGSLLLPEPIPIARFANIQVDYLDLAGEKKSAAGFLPTVQHEVDHNNGILIIDRSWQEWNL